MSSGRDVFIVDCVRTAVGKGKADGALHGVHPVELYSIVLDELIRRTKIDAKQVEDVVTGCVTCTNDQGGNISRLAILRSKLPNDVAGVQVNRLCGSGQQAIHFAAEAIASGDMELVIAGGIESMSRVPMGTDSPLLAIRDEEQLKQFAKGFKVRLLNQGVSAEMIAEKWKLNRKDLDEFSAQSHEKSARANKAGIFKGQIVPVKATKASGEAVSFSMDEGFRVPVDRSKLGELKAVFKKGGVVSAGNSSQISDGAAAVLLASGAKADQLGLRKRARIVARVVVGSDPEYMLTGPIPATKKVLEKAGLKLEDIDVFEINEAFASVVLAWAKELKVDMAKVNPNGGAIAHGHPLGATGAILMTKLVNHLEQTGKRYGLQTMCIGHGQATATIIERCGAASRSRL